MNALVIVAFVGIFGFFALLIAIFNNDETIWEWLTRPGYQPRDNWPPYPQLPAPTPAPKGPKVLKSFGPHHNPLSLAGECQSDFEQIDDRTWQCVECQLVRFEKPEVRS